MEQLTLLVRAYGPRKKALLFHIRRHIDHLLSQLDARVLSVKTTSHDHVSVALSGSDSEFARNFIARELGAAPSLSVLKLGGQYQGFLTDVGRVGYGLYVNLGVMTVRCDALVPLHTLRAQFHMNDASVRSIARAYVLVDNLPASVVLTNINVPQHRIEARLSDVFLNRIFGWLSEPHERLLVFGVTADMIRAALERTGHTRDVDKIEALGLFEFSLRCKQSSRASGIVAAIGPYLRRIPIHLFIPHEARTLLGVESGDTA